MPTLLSVSIQWPLVVRRHSGDSADMTDDKTKTSPKDDAGELKAAVEKELAGH
jgi:hypothetical protein